MIRYMLRAELLATKRTVEEGFESMLARELFKISYAGQLKVLAEWLSTADSPRGQA